MARTHLNSLYFALAVLVLGGSAIAMQMVDFNIIKKPLPIRKPLVDMPASSLGPYELVASRRLTSEIVGELGTDEYVEWTLRDRRIRDAADSQVLLFVTYYTDAQDQIPHVPEECQNQAGRIPLGDETLTMRMDSLGEEISVRRLAFRPPKELKTQDYIYYILCVNGTFHAGRQTARLRMAMPTETHLYYSKVEISFPGHVEADLPRLDRRAAELMDATIRELFENHWPPRGTEVGGYKSGKGA